MLRYQVKYSQIYFKNMQTQKMNEYVSYVATDNKH